MRRLEWIPDSGRMVSLCFQMRLLVLVLVLTGFSRAEVASVVMRPTDAKAWVGQRVPVFVELRARGSFVGTAVFDLPRIPGTILIKIGSPVVGAKDLEGEQWFVQTHEFALFSQRAGALQVPGFGVRFSRRDGFSGPGGEVRAQAPGFEVEIQRPPGSPQAGFLVTTDSLDVTETWDPAPGPAELGALFKRTIVQRAPQFPGMALVPAPSTPIDGLRVYQSDAVITDHVARGDFVGSRSETITYLVRKSGTLVIPAINYVWWDPGTETLHTKTLPAVSFEVAPPPPGESGDEMAVSHGGWFWLAAIACGGSLMVWCRRRLVEWAGAFWKRLHPPRSVAARKLLQACGENDATAAGHAWNVWINTWEPTYQPPPELRVEVVEMQRHVFGPAGSGPWCGVALKREFSKSMAAAKPRHGHEPSPVLPDLNGPGS